MQVDGRVDGPFGAGLVGPEGGAQQAIDDQVLQGGDFRGLAADADLGAAGAAGGLFALVTEHLFHRFLLALGLVGKMPDTALECIAGHN